MKLEVRDLIGDYRPATPQEILAAARSVINHRYKRGASVNAPSSVEEYFFQKLSVKEREVFAALFLDQKNQIIAYEELFFGTINSASVHPRIVVQKALEHNAAAVIVAHNHPSGQADPSDADRWITRRLIDALELVDVRLLDHFVVGKKCASLAALGFM
jgi:DNA repair protein RadC